jgi:hypothetical protein
MAPHGLGKPSSRDMLRTLRDIADFLVVSGREEKGIPR